MKKRLLALLFCLTLSLCLLASCGDETPPEGSFGNDGTTAPDTSAEEGMLTLFAPGACEYRIIYPSDDTDDEFNAARKLQTLIEEKCGVKPELVRATASNYPSNDPSVKEIFLSYIDVDEFHSAMSELDSYNSYIIRAIGNKIVISGHEREGFKVAFKAFEEYIESNESEGSVLIPKELSIIGSADNTDCKAFSDIPAYPGGMIEDFSLLGDNYDQVTIYKTDADMYGDYAARLKNDGYELYCENEISGNLYSTYTKQTELLYYYYCPNSGETRIIIADDATLPSLEEVKYTEVCEPAFICLSSLDSNGAVSGDSQGCMIRFADGSFMIYDGGNNNAYQSKQIYEALLKYAPDPQRIVVRAWVFSHFHGDHVGAFRSFADRYKNNKVITIESFIFNFCDTKEQTATINAAQMPAVKSAIRSFAPKATVYKCLTGQVYRFPGMDMEVLACMSDFIPLVIGHETADADKEQGDGNSMSTVLRLITPEGNTCMLTGDSTNIVLDSMVDRYGAEYLDSDIVTTPHHAHNRASYRARNATIKFYSAVSPEILIVTSPNMSKFTPTASYPYEVNVYVINTFDPVIYMMDKISVISLSTLKEIQ